jgi:hypothetical protein
MILRPTAAAVGKLCKVSTERFLFVRQLDLVRLRQGTRYHQWWGVHASVESTWPVQFHAGAPV